MPYYNNRFASGCNRVQPRNENSCATTERMQCPVPYRPMRPANGVRIFL